MDILLDSLTGGSKPTKPTKPKKKTRKTGGTSSSSGGGGLTDLLTGKNTAIIVALLPVLLQLLSSKSSAGALGLAGGSGLEGMLGCLNSGGLQDVVGSWVGGGPNKAITPAQVKKNVPQQTIDHLAGQTGLSGGDVTKGLSQLLPVLVNQVTPKQKVPTGSSLDQALSGLAGLLG